MRPTAIRWRHHWDYTHHVLVYRAVYGKTVWDLVWAAGKPATLFRYMHSHDGTALRDFYVRVAEFKAPTGRNWRLRLRETGETYILTPAELLAHQSVR